MGKQTQDPKQEKLYVVNTEVAKFIKSSDIKEINPYLSHNKYYVEERSKGKKIGNSSLFEELENKGICDSELGKLRESGELGEFVSLAGDYEKRNEKLAKALGEVHCEKFEPHDKIIVGAGGISPYGNLQLITLHHLYGIPFIPGSALKGSLRNCWISEKFAGDENQAIKDPIFAAIFGTGCNEKRETGKEGNMVFFDTLPSSYVLSLDVQTSHYKDYYQNGGKSEPTDFQETLPIYFTCLKKATFKLFFSCRDIEFWKDEKNKKTFQKMVKILLTQYGIGAKTALGYGVQHTRS